MGTKCWQADSFGNFHEEHDVTSCHLMSQAILRKYAWSHKSGSGWPKAPSPTEEFTRLLHTKFFQVGHQTLKDEKNMARLEKVWPQPSQRLLGAACMFLWSLTSGRAFFCPNKHAVCKLALIRLQWHNEYWMHPIYAQQCTKCRCCTFKCRKRRQKGSKYLKWNQE